MSEYFVFAIDESIIPNGPWAGHYALLVFMSDKRHPGATPMSAAQIRDRLVAKVSAGMKPKMRPVMWHVPVWFIGDEPAKQVDGELVTIIKAAFPRLCMETSGELPILEIRQFSRIVVRPTMPMSYLPDLYRMRVFWMEWARIASLVVQWGVQSSGFTFHQIVEDWRAFTWSRKYVDATGALCNNPADVVKFIKSNPDFGIVPCVEERWRL